MSRPRRIPKSLMKRRLRSSLRFEQLEQRNLLAADFAANEILVQYNSVVEADSAAQMRGIPGAIVAESFQTNAMKQNGLGTMERLKLPQGLTVDRAIEQLKNNPHVKYAEPNWIYKPSAGSNDTYYTNGQLWGMYGDDAPSAVGPSGTTNQFGSQAEKAWNNGFTGSSNVYVGIIDEGFQYAHPDLDANSWTNTFDPVDGIDNDGNGKVDDVHGWDFFYNDNSVYDGTADDHGTHVAGTVGGEGGNGTGVAGVNWSVTMISAKFLGPTGGSTSGAIQALDYLTDLKQRHGLNIVASNNSWGGGGFSQGLLDAIVRAANEGILFVAAAGNSAVNNDTSSSYPSNYSTVSGAGYEAVVAVASITNTGTKSSFSSWGANSVDIGAPGSAIISAVPSNSYASYSGTSMATPHVTGAAALYASKYPNATANDIRNAILASARPTASLSGITVTGGRLDVDAALAIAPPGGSLPSLSVSDVSVVEGNSPSTQTAVFSVTLSAASADTVTVNFATANGSATSGSDYDAASGTLTFLPGVLTQTISVTVNGDDNFEGNENYVVNLSGAANATINDSQGAGTIVDDDLPTVSIDDVTLAEGNRKKKNFTFTVSLSAPATVSTTVSYSTANGSASSSSDYVAKSGTLTIPAGQSSATLNISVNGDRTFELDETFYVDLTSVTNAVLEDPQGLGTILNDDQQPLILEGPVGKGGLTGNVPTRNDLLTLLDEAKLRWIASGAVESADVGALPIVIRTGNLPGPTLGLAAGNTIWIDRDAAGHGWYIDPTPKTDIEFDSGSVGNRVDLLSVIAHELGHLLGYDHDDDQEGMAESLSPGERHLPDAISGQSLIGTSDLVALQSRTSSNSLTRNPDPSLSRNSDGRVFQPNVAADILSRGSRPSRTGQQSSTSRETKSDDLDNVFAQDLKSILSV
jgi:subtilisin family serine protease